MLVVARIGGGNQSLVEAALVGATLVAAHQQDGLAPGIKGKGDAPDLSLPGEAQLLHVGVPGALQGVHGGAPQVGAELRQQASMRQQLVLQILCETAQLLVKGVVKQHRPGHAASMALMTYVVKDIFGESVAWDAPGGASGGAWATAACFPLGKYGALPPTHISKVANMGGRARSIGRTGNQEGSGGMSPRHCGLYGYHPLNKGATFGAAGNLGPDQKQ